MQRRVTSTAAAVLTATMASFVGQLAYAHPAIDCFEQTPMKGGNAANVMEGNDLDSLLNTNLNTQITTIKVCTNREATKIRGI